MEVKSAPLVVMREEMTLKDLVQEVSLLIDSILLFHSLTPSPLFVSAASQAAAQLEKHVTIQFQSISIRITILSGKPLLDQIIQKLNSIPSAIKRTVSFGSFALFDTAGKYVVDFDAIKNDEVLFFQIPANLNQHSASDWKDEDLDDLHIKFVDVHSQRNLFPAHSATLSPTDLVRQSEFKNELQFIDTNFYSTFSLIVHSDESTHQSSFQHPISKSIAMVLKYHNLESAVDGFVYLLLYHVGFFDDWLYIFPQYEMVLAYGNNTSYKSKPDFTIMDVLSFYRVAVIEDKREQNSETVNSEPQLIAELIAIHQNNLFAVAKKRKVEDGDDGNESKSTIKNENLVGIRVNGLKFFFYNFTMTESLSQAMTSSKQAIAETTVTRFGDTQPLLDAPPRGLNFLYPPDREIIIDTLIEIKCIVSKQGRTSDRRNSRTKHSAIITDDK